MVPTIGEVLSVFPEAIIDPSEHSAKICCPYHQDKTPSFIILLKDKGKLKAGFCKCFAAGTQVLTREGSKEIQDLIGKQVEILNGNSEWEEVEFKALGKQSLMDVHLSRNGVHKHIFATPEHEWVLERYNSQLKRVPTTELAQIKDCVLPVRYPKQTTLTYDKVGLLHGFFYGGGYLSKSGEEHLTFFTADKQKLIPLFAEIYGRPKSSQQTFYKEQIKEYPCLYMPRKVNPNQTMWKSLPDVLASDEYWLGFIMGLSAADGHFTPMTVQISNKSVTTLKLITDVCCRLGIAQSTHIYSQIRKSTNFTKNTAPISVIKLQVETLPECFWDIQRPVPKKATYSRRKWKVVSVTSTDRVEEVYCCETSTHSFVLEGNILTGNCFGCGKAASWKTVLIDQGYEVQDDPISRVKELRARLLAQQKQPNKEPIKPPLEIPLTAKSKSEFPYRFSPYLQSRGISEKIQEKFKVYDKPTENKVYMPIFGEDKKYRYFNARATEGKYFFIEEGVEKSLACIEEIDFSKPIAICEGQIDAFSLWQMGLQSVATVGASNELALKDLKKSTSIFILCYDNDTAGRLATEKAKSILGAHRCLSLQWEEDSEYKDVNNVLMQLGEELGKSYLNSLIG